MAQAVLLLAVLVLSTSFLTLTFAASDPREGWVDGRVTWFEVQNGDLKTANCHYNWNQIVTGQQVGALSDADPLFSSSCGMCVEMRCQNAVFTDGYGNSIDRSSACSDTGKSVYVTIADACPCNYPNNENSNKRWCCNDTPTRRHIDITSNAFSQLASTSLGVIGVQWRVVDCNSIKGQTSNYYPGSSSSAPSSSRSSRPLGPSGGSSSPSSSSPSSSGGGWGGFGSILGRIFG